MENIGANDKVFFFRFRHHKAMVAAAAATAPTSQNTSFASTESYPYESFDETGYGLVCATLLSFLPVADLIHLLTNPKTWIRA